MSQIYAVAGILIGLCAFASGVEILNEQLHNRTPQPISFANFVAQKPKSGHFRVSGATLCVAQGVWIENQLTGKVGNIYVPVRASATARTDSESNKPVFLMVRVDDPAILATMREIQQLPPATTPETAVKALNWMQDNRKKLYVAQPVQGVLAEGVDALDEDEKGLIESSGAKIERDFVILQENTTPQYGATLVCLAMGVGLCVWGVARLRGRAQHI